LAHNKYMYTPLPYDLQHTELQYISNNLLDSNSSSLAVYSFLFKSLYILISLHFQHFPENIKTLKVTKHTHTSTVQCILMYFVI